MAENSREAAPKPPLDSADAAWASLPAPFPPGELAELCRDIEAMFRLNPYYYFDVWRRTGTDAFHIEFENQSNKTRQVLDLTATPGSGNVLTITYDQGIKKRTVFSIEPALHGSRLTVTDDYERLPEAEREQRSAEVDKSLTAWAEALRLYFLRQKRWSWLPGWRWYIRRVWMPMKPSARRIVWFIYLITVAEFFFFLFVLLIWLIEKGD
ncbi:MAG: hypothetical protein AB1560_10240 [Pseudomonadota bacterium]